MFALTYLRSELRRRARQAMLIAAGLAMGVGLVITLTSASKAVEDAQAAVLHRLDGIGTDITVTAPARPGGNGASETGPSAQGGVLEASAVQAVARLPYVADVADTLTLTEIEPPRPGSAGLPTSIRIDGIDLTHPRLGPHASASVRSGRRLGPADDRAGVAVVDSRYAGLHQQQVGSTLTIAKARFAVIGTIDQPSGAGAADIYLPLDAAQKLAGHSLAGKVSTIYVATTSAHHLSAVESELGGLLPTSTLTSTHDLANAVSGSLANAAVLLHDLSRWVTAGVLLVSVAATALLTLTSLTQRTREIATLKALGWTGRRVIAQITAESAVTGLAGILLGLPAGYGGTALTNAYAPKLTATLNTRTSPGTHDLAVRLSSHINATATAWATLLALVATLAAGALASWHTTRLRPAQALTSIE